MTKPPPLATDDDAELDQMLARGRLSGAQYDEVERRVLNHVAPKPRSARWPLFASSAALAAGFALWFMTSGGDAPEGQPGPERPNGFAEKGGADAALGVVSVGCGGTSSHVCRLGDTLMFSVTGNPKPVYLIAYAERADERAAPRIWYFPRQDQVAPRVEAQSGTSVLPEGVRLGPPHAKGRYRVLIRLSEAAERRPQAEGLATHAEQSITLEIAD